MRPYQWQSLGLTCLRLRYLVRWLWEEIYFRSCEKRKLHGLTVAVARPREPKSMLPPNTSVEVAFERMEEMLSLLETYAPIALRGMQHRSTRIAVASCPAGGYFALSNTIALPLPSVVRGWPAVTGGMVIHEWTHARVSAAHAHGWLVREETLAREEELSMRQEIDFVRRIPADVFPHGELLISRLRKDLQSEYWTRDARKEAFKAWRAEIRRARAEERRSSSAESH